MQGKRLDRVNHLVQMELSRLILHKVRDPRLGFVTVTHVDVSPDLKSARVFYSVMGDDKAKEASRTALDRARGFLQREIGTSLKLKYTPKLNFSQDDSLDHSLEIDRVLKEIHEEKRD